MEIKTYFSNPRPDALAFGFNFQKPKDPLWDIRNVRDLVDGTLWMEPAEHNLGEGDPKIFKDHLLILLHDWEIIHYLYQRPELVRQIHDPYSFYVYYRCLLTQSEPLPHWKPTQATVLLKPLFPQVDEFRDMCFQMGVEILGVQV